MWGTYKDAPLDEVPISEETFTDLALFRWLVRGVRKRGGDVAIASFGRKDVAFKAMCYALGEDHGVTITTPADYADPAPEAEGSEAAPRLSGACRSRSVGGPVPGREFVARGQEHPTLSAGRSFRCPSHRRQAKTRRIEEYLRYIVTLLYLYIVIIL